MPPRLMRPAKLTFDVRWRYAAGVGDWDSVTAFAHTVLVNLRARLRESETLFHSSE